VSSPSLGVPYHSWRITHAKHHASTGHMTQDQVFVPATRSDLGLPPLDPAREDVLGSRVTEEVKKELWEAIGDSPIGAILTPASYLVSIFLEACSSLSCSDDLYVAWWMDSVYHDQRFWPTQIS
jgi:hypothetical protein